MLGARMAEIETIRFGPAGRFELQPGQRRLLAKGTAVKLGSRAFDLLAALVAERERTLARDELLQRVWPGVVVEPNNLEVQVWALRRALGTEAIATIPRPGLPHRAAGGVATDARRTGAAFGAAGAGAGRAPARERLDARRVAAARASRARGGAGHGGALARGLMRNVDDGRGRQSS